MRPRPARIYAALSLAGVALAPIPAAAHGLIGTPGLVAGLAHPVGGWDHLIALILVGALSTRFDRIDLWRLPACFLSGMALSAGATLILGSVTLPPFGLALCVGALGIVLALPAPRRNVAYALAGATAILHGASHMIGIAAQTDAAFYIFGLLLMTAALHLTGVFAALLIADAPRGLLALRALGLVGAAAAALLAAL